MRTATAGPEKQIKETDTLLQGTGEPNNNSVGLTPRVTHFTYQQIFDPT